MIPSAFISYSWDNEGHKKWVKVLATKLRGEGIDIKLDQWETIPGDQLPHFMEKSIRENDYILIICTPKYKNKSDNREGGVGYEGDIMTAEVLRNKNHRKFIPVLKDGNNNTSIPTWLEGKYYIDMSSDEKYDQGYQDIITTILNIRELPPPLAKISHPKYKSISIKTKEVGFRDIKINGIVIDEVTTPLMLGSRGSGLYKIPFELSETPNHEWVSIFLKNWNFPTSFTNMHRPGIAKVIGNKIFLDGTTIEEVQKYHRDTLVDAVTATNKKLKEVYAMREREEKRAKEAEEKHRRKIDDISKGLNFD